MNISEAEAKRSAVRYEMRHPRLRGRRKRRDDIRKRIYGVVASRIGHKPLFTIANARDVLAVDVHTSQICRRESSPEPMDVSPGDASAAASTASLAPRAEAVAVAAPVRHKRRAQDDDSHTLATASAPARARAAASAPATASAPARAAAPAAASAPAAMYTAVSSEERNRNIVRYYLLLMNILYATPAILGMYSELRRWFNNTIKRNVDTAQHDAVKDVRLATGLSTSRVNDVAANMAITHATVHATAESPDGVFIQKFIMSFVPRVIHGYFPQVPMAVRDRLSNYQASINNLFANLTNVLNVEYISGFILSVWPVIQEAYRAVYKDERALESMQIVILLWKYLAKCLKGLADTAYFLREELRKPGNDDEFVKFVREIFVRLQRHSAQTASISADDIFMYLQNKDTWLVPTKGVSQYIIRHHPANNPDTAILISRYPYATDINLNDKQKYLSNVWWMQGNIPNVEMRNAPFDGCTEEGWSTCFKTIELLQTHGAIMTEDT